MNLRRRKQPEAVRAQILRAAEQVLAEAGSGSCTVDKILEKTDLSKGGLQHHFRTKQALLDALFEQLLDAFRVRLDEALLDEPDGPAKHIRAYVRATCISASEIASSARASVMLLLDEPRYQCTWAQYVDEICSTDTISEELLLTCRYAADGLWFNHVIQGGMSNKHVEAVRNYLLHVTRT